MKRILHLVLPMTGKMGMLKYALLGILSGLCSFLFINSVTRVVGLMVAGDFGVSKEFILLFASIILLFVWIRRTLSLKIIRMSQSLFWNLRKQILSLVLKASYQQLSGRRTDVQSAIVSDVNAMTAASMSIIDFFSATILAISCLVYLATISLILFSLTLVIALIGVTIYHVRSKGDVRNFQKARKLENQFQSNLNAILDGFKEIFMEPRKGRFIFDHKIKAIANEAYKNNTTAYTGFLNNQITGQVLFYFLISSVLLFFSITLHIETQDTISFIFTLLYLLTSIEAIMICLPILARARVAANHLLNLKKNLEEADLNTPVIGERSFAREFDHITVTDLQYQYEGKNQSFGIGPINFDIQKGETIFIYGGNGSGKTTFVHNILGMCVPSSGEIRCNGVVINGDNYNDYRTIFSVVFSDYYLFSELIGIDNINVDKLNYYLRLFELDDKVTFEGNAFSTTELSTGQKKRLALIATLLEEKPVLVIDEWAADQDPYFRRKFYTEIIPLLKAEGITIIAITHDDKYYKCADKLFKMDYGKLVEESATVYQ